ncbi:MAG: hypothetical protein ACPL88_04420, partial [Bryobacteraceae bacterium]
MKPLTIGLVAAGRLSRSLVTRLPGLPERLGPVLAPSSRLASRLVNLLRAGHPVERYEELEDVQMLLVAVPDEMTAQVANDLARSVSDWRGKVVVLCESRHDCTALQLLADRGAATASLTPIPGLNDRYLVEGDRRAVREARSLPG